MVDAEGIGPMMTEFAVEIFVIADPADEGSCIRYRSLHSGAQCIDSFIIAILKPAEGGGLPDVAERYVDERLEGVQLPVGRQRGKGLFFLEAIGRDRLVGSTEPKVGVGAERQVYAEEGAAATAYAGGANILGESGQADRTPAEKAGLNLSGEGRDDREGQTKRESAEKFMVGSHRRSVLYRRFKLLGLYKSERRANGYDLL